MYILYIECYNASLTYKTMLFYLQLEMLQTMLKDPACSAALEDWFRSLPQRNETGGNEESDDDEQIVVGFFYVLFVQVFQTSIFDILLYVKSDEYFKRILY